ncbi:MAG: aminotransferase class V-fold PLP-dependent enzyme [Actinomycetota bacterium]|nr:aminotransferase class V-fold PLP-dependent enzyme [Actinomycetota bacterium]
MNIYFDNAATSYPKPQAVSAAVADFFENIGANPGRSGHRLSVEAARSIYLAKEAMATILGVTDPLRIIFTHNATYAINMALFGLLKAGDHVITSSMEHNSVARPLRHLESLGVELTIIPADPKTSLIDPADFKAALRPSTKLISLVHASNVTGAVMDIEGVGEIASEAGAIFMVDAAQTAGVIEIDVDKMKIDILAFTGHKSLFGPQGTGGLYIGEGVEISPLIFGGTGSASESDIQPDFLPDSLESGTPNTHGLVGLLAGAEFILDQGVGKVRAHELKLIGMMGEGLAKIEGLTQPVKIADEARLPIFSFNLEGLSASKVGYILDSEHDIMVRVGLHCSPWAHLTIGTHPHGTVRASLSYLNTEAEVEAFFDALIAISKRG